MKPRFHLTQSSPLIDTSLDIQMINLPPNERVTITAEVCDNLGTSWASHATFTSGWDGKIDLTTAQPIAGTYLTPDVTGLFWSMVPLSSVEPKKRTPFKPLETKLVLTKEEEVLAVTSIIRSVLSPEVERLPVRENGLVGSFFFHPSREQLPIILVLGGSEGGLIESNAALLASHGFNTLALAYFGVEDLPKELVNIPLDYIEKALDWLSCHPNVDATKLGVFGTSKGGELALLSASIFSRIKAVVGYVPSGLVYPGIGQEASGVSSWRYKGRSIPFAYGKIPKEVTKKVEEAMQTGAPISWRSTYQYWARDQKQAEIAVEAIQGPILLVSGGDDQLWPADLLSENVMSRLRKNKHPFTSKHFHYPQAGHSFVIPGLPTTQSVESPFGNGRLLLGGTPKENAHAQYKA